MTHLISVAMWATDQGPEVVENENFSTGLYEHRTDADLIQRLIRILVKHYQGLD